MSTLTSLSRPIPSSADDCYSRAELALRALTAEPGDVSAFAEYLKSLVALGLGGAGRRLIDCAAGSPGIGFEGRQFLEQLRDVVVRCPSGRMDWRRCDNRFIENLSALRERWPAAAQAVGEANVAGFELYRDSNGIHQVLDLQSLQWCCGLSDRRAAAEAAFTGRSPINPTAPIAFDGIGLGELLDNFMRRSRRTFLSYSAAVSVIEPEPTSLAIAMRLHSWKEMLAEPRLAVFVGPNSEHEFAAFLNADPHQPIPASVQRQSPKGRAPSAVPQFIETIARDRAARKQIAIAEVAGRHHAADHCYWTARFAEALDGRGRPLRVMGITSRFTTVLRYSMAELLGAARRAGCEIDLVWEEYDHAIEYNVPARAAAFNPDLIVMLSRLRYEFPDIPRNIPFLCWDQDALPVMRTSEAGTSLDRLTFVAGYGAWFGRSHLAWPARQALAAVPIAASNAYVTAPPDLPINERFRCDIAYISHCSESPLAMRDRLAENWAGHPILSRIFAGVTDRLVSRSANGHNWTPSEIHLLTYEVAAECGVRLAEEVLRELCMTCMAISDRAFRHFALECVARYAERSHRRFNLYGSGWEHHARLSPFAAGRVSFGDEFVAACRGAKLNLQLIEGGFMHSRALDGLAAGGAFLTRATRYDAERPRLQRLAADLADRGARCGDPAMDFWLRTIPLEPDALALLPDLPRISFTDLDSLAATADSLLDDDSMRERIAENMRRAALAEFSYDAHWSRLVAFIRSSLESV